jgi:hypothetical protein
MKGSPKFWQKPSRIARDKRLVAVVQERPTNGSLRLFDSDPSQQIRGEVRVLARNAENLRTLPLFGLGKQAHESAQRPALRDLVLDERDSQVVVFLAPADQN